jgi:beta-xylosidase
VLYHAASATYVMWYEDRWAGQGGYAVATSPTPQGPFATVANSVKPFGAGRVGDYDLFLDDDGAAYHIRTGLTVERLTPDFRNFSGVYVNLPNGAVEGPSMFKRNGLYYLTSGVGCCACRGGSNVLVYTAPSPLGPFTLQGQCDRWVGGGGGGGQGG